MPRDLVDVIDYLLPLPNAGSAGGIEADPTQTPAPAERPARVDSAGPLGAGSSAERAAAAAALPEPQFGRYVGSRPPRTARPAVLPIITLPIGDRDVVRAAFAWNLSVEIARLGGNVTLVAPSASGESTLWPAIGRGPLGAQLELVEARDLGELNRAALDIAVTRTADSGDGGVVLVRVPPEWLTASPDGRALLRWVLLFASPDSPDLREAYGLAKSVIGTGHATRIGVTIHGARRIRDAERAFARVSETALQHLRHSLVSYGLLVDDLHIYRASVAQRPIGLEHPQSRAALALRDVARLLFEDARELTVG